MKPSASIQVLQTGMLYCIWANVGSQGWHTNLLRIMALTCFVASAVMAFREWREE